MEKYLAKIKDFVMLRIPYYYHHAAIVFIVANLLKLIGLSDPLAVIGPTAFYLLREVYQYFTTAGKERVAEGLPQFDTPGALGGLGGGAVASFAFLFY